jgi:predicted Zn-dependent peptidase
MPEVYRTFDVAGVKVALGYAPHVESVTIGLWICVGGRHESAAQSGIAHFIEHLVFKGTKHRSAQQISDAIESRGGDLNAFTAEENTCYYARVSAQHLPLALDVLLDLVFQPTFPVDEIERERNVILEEIRMYEDQPSSVSQEMLNTLLWPDHALGRPLTGTVATVSDIKRKELLHFWDKHYQRGNITLCLAGKVEEQSVRKLIQKYLSKIKSTGRYARPTSPRVQKKLGPTIKIMNRPIQQVNLSLGVRGYSRSDSRRYALRLMSIVLGENMSSRLFQSVRERHGLAYSIHSAVSLLSDTGSFSIHAGLDSNQLLQALKLVHKECNRIADKPLSKNELRKAKDYAIGQLQLNMESTTNQMFWIGEHLLGFGRIHDPSETILHLNAVTVHEVQSVSRDLLKPQKWRIACVGSGLDSKKIQSALGLSL